MELSHLNAWYTNGNRLPILQNVSLSVASGETLGIVGPNGCGKTTLLRVIAGLHRSWEGSVHGVPQRPGAFRYLPQDYRNSFFPWASIGRSIQMLSGSRLGHGDCRTRMQELADVFGITLNFSLKPAQCSGGMLQQAAFIRAFYSDATTVPELIIADEPFASLDAHVSRKLRGEFVRQIKRGQLRAIVVLHGIDELADVCDRILVIPDKPFTTVAGTEAHLTVAEVIQNPLSADGVKPKDESLTALIRHALTARL